METCRAYVEKFHLLKRAGLGMMLIGPYGCGKTWLIDQIEKSMSRWLDRPGNPNPYHYKAVCVQSGTMLACIKESFEWKPDERDRMMSDFTDSDLLMIDDLGTEYQTDWAMNEMGRIIDERYAEKRPIIITLNKLEALDAHQTRIVDRIGERCIQVDMSRCPNLREKLRVENRRKFKEITGV